MNAQIVLGCHGYRRYGISMCKGTSNVIAQLNKLGSDSEEILDFLDNHCKIFDKILEDLNQINSVIGCLNRYSVISKHINDILYNYISMHKGCGLYLFVETIQP